MTPTGFHRSILAFSVMAGSIFAMAETPALINRIQNAALPVNRVATMEYSHNPATMLYSDSVSLSSIAVSADYSSLDRAVMEQTGTGSRLLSIGANSYRKLSKDMAVWGNASFTTGSYRNIKWSDCIDYEYVAPYVLGDDTGGNLTTQCYKFSGGIAKSVNRWTVGAQARYRAEIAYRDHDPRIKTIVSDLDVTIGASLEVADKRILGVNGGISVYNQNCDLDFYNPVNDINTYTLTGMGTYYRRFMGNTNKNSGYNSIGFSAGAQFLSTDKSGFKASVCVESYRMKQQLRNFNNITLGFTDNLTISTSASYRWYVNNRLTIEPLLTGFFSHRKGTENLFGNSTGASYDKIGSNSFYRHNRFDAAIALPIQWTAAGKTYITIAPHSSFSANEERYATPLRKTDVLHIVPGVMASLSMNRGAWLWDMAINGEYRLSHSQEPIWTDLDTTSALGACQLNNYSMLDAESCKGDIRLNVTRHMGPVALNGSIFYSLQHYRSIGNTNIAGISVGVIF